MAMEQLIPVINKIQDVFNTVGEREIIELPQIVVVGAQSSGKSSVLENVVGRDFLPRGSGIVTRVPLVMQLNHVPPLEERKETGRFQDSPDAEEWGTFLHAPGKYFDDFVAIKKEIADQTVRLCGDHQNIKNTPIHLKIFSPHVVNLTLVDLPGLTKVPVGDQPQDIEQQIRQLILHYIQNPNSIILAVSPANSDIANSDALKLAKEVDPEGHRTLAVVTKIDLMDRGTDATQILLGNVIPVKLGIIGVINRSQYDIDHNVAIREALKNEQRFFQKHYKTISHKCGCAYLSKTLHNLLLHHIQTCLPSLRQRIKTLQTQTQAALDALGQPLRGNVDETAAILTTINTFVEAFKASIQGTNLSHHQYSDPSGLSGGALINQIFHDDFGTALSEMDALDGLDEEDIIAEIRNAAGTRRALFVPEIAFEQLVKRQIKKLELPGLHCVELVHEQLIKVMHMSLEIKELSRFDVLREEINHVTSTMMQKCLPNTREMVKNLVEIQLAYINTNHPDFEGGAEAVMKTMERVAREGDAPASDPEPVPDPEDEMTDAIEEPKPQKTGLFDVFFGRSRQSQPHGLSSAMPNNSPSGNVAVPRVFTPPSHVESKRPLKTKADELQVELIESLIRSYFKIVVTTIQDGVPKAIMMFLVNKIQDSIHHELVRSLYRPENFSRLLEEDPHVAQQRSEAQELLAALQQAATILSEVSDQRHF